MKHMHHLIQFNSCILQEIHMSLYDSTIRLYLKKLNAWVSANVNQVNYMNQMNHVIKCMHHLIKLNSFILQEMHATLVLYGLIKNGRETLRKPRPWYVSCTTNWIMLMHFFFPVRKFALFKYMLRSRWMTESGKYDIGISCRFTTSWVWCCTIGKLDVAW